MHMETKLDRKQSNLNDKQRLFIERMLIDNMSPRDAYLAVYKVKNKQTAGVNASRLMKTQQIITEMALLSNQLKALAHTPKHRIMQELKEFLAVMKQDLNNASNRKYYLEALDMINKMEGYYQHNQTITKINLEGGVDFGGWNPDSPMPIELVPSDEISSTDGKFLPLNESSEGAIDWDPESEDENGVPYETMDENNPSEDDEEDMPF